MIDSLTGILLNPLTMVEMRLILFKLACETVNGPCNFGISYEKCLKSMYF